MNSYLRGYPQVYQPGYPQVYHQVTINRFNTQLMLGIGLFAVLIIIIYYIWAYTKFKYSSDRLAGKLVAKYKIANDELKESDTDMLVASDISFNSDKTQIFCTIQQKNKETLDVIDSKPFSIQISNQCNPLSGFCIAI